jgi:hypothetical protein
MTPKEKANELVNKIMELNSTHTKLSDYSRIYTPTAKQCALIAVDEILKVCLLSAFFDGGEHEGSKYIKNLFEYYTKVSDEIEIL